MTPFVVSYTDWKDKNKILVKKFLVQVAYILYLCDIELAVRIIILQLF